MLIDNLEFESSDNHVQINDKSGETDENHFGKDSPTDTTPN